MDPAVSKDKINEDGYVNVSFFGNVLKIN